MRDFIRRHLDPAGRLGEVLFGLIMALGFTSAVRLGIEEPDNRTLFVAILGCNVAWGIVDGVMYVLGELFERGRRARLLQKLRGVTDDEQALGLIGDELDGRLLPLTTPDERRRIYTTMLGIVRRGSGEPARVRGEDLAGGLAVGLVIVLATLPIVLPYLLFADPTLAARLSHGIALVLLFTLGVWWARVVGASPLRIGSGLTLLGGVLVLVTVALGG
jgi:VIT1/CCC1 family predicted Fe2+/Mn2+ transporter